MKSLTQRIAHLKPWQISGIVLGVFIFLLLLYQGLGDFAALFLMVYLLLALLFVRIREGSLRDLKPPPEFLAYILFLALFSISFLWSKNLNHSFIYFTLFLSGALFWVISYNSKVLLKRFEILVIFLGIFFGILTVNHRFGGDLNDVWTFSLYKYAVPPLHHHHIGDLWALVLIVLGVKYVEKDDKRLLALIFFGFYFLYLSLSRSAYAALISGSIYLLWRLSLLGKKRFVFWSFIFMAIILFFYAGAKKATLSAHSGFLIQGILGTLRNPLGVGVGGFELISKDLRNSPWGISAGSSNAHNIILDFMTGMGVLGLSFVFWLAWVVKRILVEKNKEGYLYRAIFLSLTVNFLFDYTYLIPTMLWIWFTCLGLSQARVRRQ